MNNKLIKQLLIVIPIGGLVGIVIGKIWASIFPNVDVLPFLSILFLWLIIYINNRKKGNTDNESESN